MLPVATGCPEHRYRVTISVDRCRVDHNRPRHHTTTNHLTTAVSLPQPTPNYRLPFDRTDRTAPTDSCAVRRPAVQLSAGVDAGCCCCCCRAGPVAVSQPACPACSSRQVRLAVVVGSDQALVWTVRSCPDLLIVSHYHRQPTAAPPTAAVRHRPTELSDRPTDSCAVLCCRCCQAVSCCCFVWSVPIIHHRQPPG